ncbi:MAG TPA: PIG-L family deacetylase [Candidatus Acidoferrales bacterium]|nr:PIG-L family deacetylase [Candidatus Acidoferrales bacterium]
MKKRGIAKLAWMVAFAAVVSIAATLFAQSRPGFPLADSVEAINQSRVATRILYITAHPDDEDAGLLAYLARGINADVALLTITRGQGGQNAVGPEQDGQLGVVRTTELLSAGSHYGVHQYFTRAVDTGFSKSPKWTMAIWGDQLPMEDMVRVIRTFRPDVVINGWGGVKNGHGQHQASGLLTPQAVAEAADASKFPDQLSEGLPAWKTSLELRPGNFGFVPGPGRGGRGGRGGGPQAGGRGDGAPASPPPPSVHIPTDEISPLWGVSYVEMGAEGHGQQPSQGTPQLFGGGFGRRQSNLVIETSQGEPGGVFDPRLLDQSITSLADRYPSYKSMMAPALESADKALAAAATQELSLDRNAAAHSIAEAGKEIASLTEEVSQQGGQDKSQALFDLDEVHERIDDALEKVVSPSIALNADRNELVAGENFSVTASFPDKPAVDVQVPIESSSLDVPKGWTVSPAPRQNGPYRFNVAIPADAVAPPLTPAQAILPFPTPLVRFVLPVTLDNYKFDVVRTVEFSETKTVRIETYPLELVPAVTLTVEPPEIMVPEKHASAPIKLVARVRYHGDQAAKVSVGLDAAKGWTVQPIAPLDFSEPGDQLVRYAITPPAGLGAGAYPLHPYAKLGDQTFRTSLEPIPTLPTRDWSEPNDATVHVLNLNIPAGLHIGYVAADNDPLPEVLRQTGVQVDMLDEVALSFGDLSRYDAIVLGIRAYELRPDVARANSRLLDYVKNGGTLVVQYEREPSWGRLKPTPYPASMDGSKANTLARTTDPDSPVQFLAPQNPLLNTPNKITQQDFKGWVQERGTYYWDKWDSHYTPILALQDPDEPPVDGSLMYARYGKGVYIYAGLVFFRELPAGVPGAYRLFVNLISQTPHH